MVSRIPLHLSFFVSLLGGFCAGAAAKDIASAVLVDHEGRTSGRLSITAGPAPETSTLKTVIGYEESVDGIIIEFLDVGKCDFDKLTTGGSYVREGASYELFLRKSPFASERALSSNDAAVEISIVRSEDQQIYVAKGIALDLQGADKDLFFDKDGTVVAVDIVSENKGYQVCGELKAARYSTQMQPVSSSL